MSKELIRLRDLCMAFDDEPVLDHINLYINDKEFLTLLGPSGCGKTTTLRIIGGFATPTSGDVLFDGVRINDVPPYQRQINTVFQKYALFPHLNVYENIAFGLRMQKLPEAEIKERVMEMLETVSLKGFEHRRPEALSGGQQQRVAIARALVNRPKVLLLDEPLAALDLKLRKDMQIELKRIQQQVGITFIYVTHDQEEALAVADRIGVMNKGKIEQIAAPQNLYQRPATEYVATFIGLTNRLPGASNGDEAVVFGQRVPLLAGSAKGDSVAVLVRPENLTLALAGSSDSHVGERARVEVIHFLGSLVRVDTVITSGEYQRWNKGEQLKATVQLPASELPAGLAVGDDVIVTPRPVAALAC